MPWWFWFSMGLGIGFTFGIVFTVLLTIEPYDDQQLEHQDPWNVRR